MKIKFGKNTSALKCLGVVALTIYTAVLFRYNFVRIFDNVLGGDEAYSVALAKMGLKEMFLETASDVHPPLYYLFLRFLSMFGKTGTVYHLSALIPYLFILVFAVTVVRKEFGLITSLILITMSSMAQSAVLYNVEIRMYSLANMFTLFAFFQAYRILQSNRWQNWILFAVMSLGAAYSHYYALLSVAIFYVLLFMLAVRKREYLRKWVAASLVAVVGYLPWLYFFLRTFLEVTNSWWVEQYFSWEDCLLFWFDYNWVVVVFVLVFLVYMIYSKGLLKVTKTNGEKKYTEDIHVELGGERTALSAEAMWAIGGLISAIGTAAVGMAVSKLANPVFIPRYLFPLSACMYLIFGVFFSKPQLKWVWSICFLAVFLQVEFPVYQANTYLETTVLDIEATVFLQEVTLNGNDMFLTNSSQHAWTILDYYYEGCSKKYIGDLSQIQSAETESVWLLWTAQLGEDEIAGLTAEGWSCEYIRAGCLGNEDVLYVYRLEKYA